MVNSGQIGEEARKLDERSILERMKINRSSIVKMIGAFFVYIGFMTIFYFLL